MKMVFLIYFSALLFFQISCTSNNSVRNDQGRIVCVNLDDMEPLDSLIDSVLFVKLETTDEVLVANNLNIKYYNSCIYVNNRRSGNVFIFDKTGKILKIVDRRGEGPEEYASITDFLVNEKGIFIYDGMRGDLLQYNEVGEYKGKTKLRESASHIIEYDDKYILYLEAPGEKESALYVYNRDGKLINNCLNEMETPEYLSFSMKYPISVVNDGVLISHILDNQVHLFSGNDIEQTYTFDFGKYNLKETASKKKNKNNRKYLNELIATEDQVLWIDGLLSYKSWYIASLNRGKDSPKICILPDGKAIYSFDISEHPFDFFEGEITTDKSCLIGVIQAQYVSQFKELKAEGVKMNKYMDKLLEFDLKEDDNPILCFFTL